MYYTSNERDSFSLSAGNLIIRKKKKSTKIYTKFIVLTFVL